MYLLYYVRMLCMYACMYLVRMCRATYIMYGCCKNKQLLSHSTLVALASTLPRIYSPSDHYRLKPRERERVREREGDESN